MASCHASSNPVRFGRCRNRGLALYCRQPDQPALANCRSCLDAMSKTGYSDRRPGEHIERGADMLRERRLPPRDIFPPDPWTLGTVRYDSQLAREYASAAETMFALSNGYLGIRGTPDEG